VQRHESLRTTFAVVDGRPMQTISLTGKVDFEFESISGRAGVQSDAEIARIASAYVQLLFDLARNPLFRVKLLQFGNDHWMLMLVMHHIISDGWSLENLLKELQTLHAAALEGRPSPMSELPVRYSDYALWQRCEIDSGALQASRESWRQRDRYRIRLSPEGVPNRSDLRQVVQTKGGALS
jgi:hypothetical protein